MSCSGLCMRFGKSSVHTDLLMLLTMTSCLIEMSMVASHLIWLVRTRGIRQRAKELGLTFDEFGEGKEWQAKGIDFERKLLKLFKRRSVCDDLNTSTESATDCTHVVPKTVPNASV